MKNNDNIDTNTRVNPSITKPVLVERSYIIKFVIKWQEKRFYLYKSCVDNRFSFSCSSFCILFPCLFDFFLFSYFIHQKHAQEASLCSNIYIFYFEFASFMQYTGRNFVWGMNLLWTCGNHGVVYSFLYFLCIYFVLQLYSMYLIQETARQIHSRIFFYVVQV